MESNDSREIPDRGETSDIPGLPSGAGKKKSDRKSNSTRQRNKRGDSKQESNDSLVMPDQGRGDIRHPRPPFRVGRKA